MELVAGGFQDFQPAVPQSARDERVLLIVLIDILALVGMHSLYWLFAGINQPIADLHQFRQTQTAITAYWMAQGGPWFAYDTPVLGYPWSIPFEFPLYQYLLAVMAALGVPIAVGGRLLSYAFYLGLLWPLKLLFRDLSLGKTDYLIMAILLLSAPIYIYWSRTVMMESCALFFSAAWLAFLIRFLRTRTPRDVWLATIFGVLAIGVKLTTFAAFGLIGGIAWLQLALGAYRGGTVQASARVLIGGACAGLVPIVAGALWVAWSDQLKSENLLGTLLTSSALTQWNFGTLDQRFSSQFWLNAISFRMLSDILGFSIIPALIAGGAALGSPKYTRLLMLAIAGFFAPLLIFTNLHIEHNYYQYANAVFLLAACAFGLSRIAGSGRPLLCAVMVAIVVVGQLTYFNSGFAGVITADYSGSRQVQVGALANRLTRPGQSLLVIGDDWSSAIPFDSERKAIAFPFSTPAEIAAKILAKPQAWLGDAPLGAIVFCPDQLRNYGAGADEFRQFVMGRRVLGDAAGCQLLAPGR